MAPTRANQTDEWEKVDGAFIEAGEEVHAEEVAGRCGTQLRCPRFW
jgi:hypothetical protein